MHRNERISLCKGHALRHKRLVNAIDVFSCHIL